MSEPKAQKIGRVRASVLKWLGVPIELTTGEFWGAWVGDSRAAGQEISEKTILSLSAAYACTRLISETTGSLPFKVYQRTNNGRMTADNHPLQFVLSKSPNQNSTPVQFWSAIVASMMLWGNGFAEIRRIGDRVAGLEFLHPSRIKPVKDDKGNITGYQYVMDANTKRSISLDNMLHIPAFGVDGLWGVSAISYGAQIFGSALASSMAANKTFENGLSQTVALKIDRVIKPEQREDFRHAMQLVSGAINAGKTAVLEAGMDAKTIGINPKDAQLLESRTFSVEDVCRWFGVDPSMIGHGTAVSNWGSGLEQKMIGFLTFTLRPILTRIEQSVNKTLINSDVFYAEFSIEGLLRADSAGRASFYATMITNGIMTRDEARVKENLTATGGNSAKQTIQLGFTTLDKMGATNES